MKTLLALTLTISLLAGGCASKPQAAKTLKTTYSSFDLPGAHGPEKEIAAGELNFKGLRRDEMFAIYQEYVNRTLVKSPGLPEAAITLKNQTPTTRVGMIQLMDTALAQAGIAMVYSADTVVKAVPVSQVASEAGPLIDLPADKLPDCGSYMVRIVHLKKTKPSELVPVLQPFSKVPNGIIPMDREKVIVLRDFSSNIKQMLKLVDIAEGSGGH